MQSKKIIFPFWLLIFCCVFVSDSVSQEIITLNNPSFEDIPRKGGQPNFPIKGWHDCGLSKFPGESPPDILPTPDHVWEVSKKAKDGLTYISLVTRFNDTYESVSQRLEMPMKGGHCYSVSVYLAKSETYKSGTSRSMQLENFTFSIQLDIWGGTDYCEKEELLAESEPVNNEEWVLYEFTLSPLIDCTYFTIEAFYDTPILEAYNGHVLVDHFSPIREIDCN